MRNVHVGEIVSLFILFICWFLFQKTCSHNAIIFIIYKGNYFFNRSEPETLKSNCDKNEGGRFNEKLWYERVIST